MIPISWNRCRTPVTLSLFSPSRLDPRPRLHPDPPAVDPCCRLFYLLGSCLLLPPRVWWRSLCGAWWCCLHVSPPLDAVTARGNVWPVVCSCSGSSCIKPSTPWWVYVCVCESMLIRAFAEGLVNTVMSVCVETAARSLQHLDAGVFVIFNLDKSNNVMCCVQFAQIQQQNALLLCRLLSYDKLVSLLTDLFLISPASSYNRILISKELNQFV